MLLFNTTGDRNSSLLLLPLKTCKFQSVVFCPNVVDDSDSATKGILSSRSQEAPTELICVLFLDLQNYMVTKENQLKRCYENQDAWLSADSNNTRSAEDIHTLANIRSALAFIEEIASKETQQVVRVAILLIGIQIPKNLCNFIG